MMKHILLKTITDRIVYITIERVLNTSNPKNEKYKENLWKENTLPIDVELRAPKKLLSSKSDVPIACRTLQHIYVSISDP